MRDAPLGMWAMPVALLIAAIKAGLIATSFMHLTESSAVDRLVVLVLVLVSVLMVVLLVALMHADVVTRETHWLVPHNGQG